ncbi:MAG: HlyD family efflux transporter periplasmic adaptor subunit [Chitinophagales bacterium]
MSTEAQELNRIQIRSDEVQAILSYIPRWIIRWGITVIFVVVAMLFGMAAYVQYPDIVYGRAALTTQSPPTAVIARTNGKLTNLKIEDGDEVQKDEVLAVIDNPTTYEAFLKLQKQVNAWEKLKVTAFSTASKPSIKGLGNLQTTYSQLLKGISDYQDWAQLKTNKKRKEAIEEEIENYKKLRDDMNRQYQLIQEDIALIKKNMDRYETLADSGDVSKMEAEAERSRWLQQKRMAENIKMQQQQYNSQIASLETQIVTYSSDSDLRKLQLESNITTTLNSLKGELEAWEVTFIVKAPVSGKASVPPTSKEQKTVQSGEEILTIVPKNAGKIFALVHLEAMGLGKVETDQDVNIKLDGYPHSKFGLLKGKIATIDPIPRDNMYRTEIELSKGLITTFNDTLVFKQDMTGTAEIITKDATVMERILEQFIELTQ